MTTFKTLFLIHFHFLFFLNLTMISIFSSSNEITKLKTIIFLRWKEMVTMRLGSVDGINKLDNKCGSNFWVCARTPKVWPFKWKLLSSTFLTNPVVWPFKWQLLSDTFLWHILSYCKRLLHQWIQPRKAIDLCTAQPPLEGTWAKTLLVDAHQPELGFSHSWGNAFPRFSGKSPLLEKRHFAIQIW